jgi:hypothetical protein
MKVSSRILGCVVALAMGLSSFAHAQDVAPPKGITVNVVNIAPGTGVTFESVAKKFKEAADKLEDVPAYFAYSSVIGNDGQYIFAAPFAMFAELANDRQILAEAYGPEELAKISELFQKTVVSTESYIVIPRPDLGISAPDPTAASEITLSIAIKLRMGKEEQYQEYLKKLVEATRATSPETYWSTYQPGPGAKGIWAVRINTSWAEFDVQGKSIPQRLNEHFGERAGKKIYDEGNASIENIEYTISRFRLDLSHAGSTE